MGAPIIGRTDCPECKFGGAHVKRSEKCDYRFCPECGAIYHAKTERQKADLAAKTRPLGVGPSTPTPTQGVQEAVQAPAAAPPAPTPTPKPAKAVAKPAEAPAPTPTPTPAPTPAAPAPAPRKSWLSGL